MRPKRAKFVLTRAQRAKLKEIYNLGPHHPYLAPEEREAGITAVPFTYRQLRRMVLYDRYGWICLPLRYCPVIDPEGVVY